MHLGIVFLAVLLAFGAGAFYGRKVEQKIVGLAVAEFAKLDAVAHASAERLKAKIAYLRKYL